MSDLVGNPEDRFSRVTAHIMKRCKHWPVLLRHVYVLSTLWPFLCTHWPVLLRHVYVLSTLWPFLCTHWPVLLRHVYVLSTLWPFLCTHWPVLLRHVYVLSTLWPFLCTHWPVRLWKMDRNQKIVILTVYYFHLYLYKRIFTVRT